MSEFDHLYSQFPFLTNKGDRSNIYVGFNHIKDDKNDNIFVIKIDYNIGETELIGILKLILITVQIYHFNQ